MSIRIRQNDVNFYCPKFGIRHWKRLRTHGMIITRCKQWTLLLNVVIFFMIDQVQEQQTYISRRHGRDGIQRIFGCGGFWLHYHHLSLPKRPEFRLYPILQETVRQRHAKLFVEVEFIKMK